RRQEDDWAPIVTAAACLGGVSTLFLAPVRADFHHIAYGGPFGLLALSLAARRPRLRPAVLATLCLAAALAVVTYAHKTAFTWSASRAKGSFRAEAEKLAGYAAIARAVPPDGTIVVGPMAGFYYFFLRDAAVPITHIPSTQDKFLTDEQWRWCAERIAALGPGAILLPPKPWRELVARRPDLRDRYRPQGELLVRSPCRRRPPARAAAPTSPAAWSSWRWRSPGPAPRSSAGPRSARRSSSTPTRCSAPGRRRRGRCGTTPPRSSSTTRATCRWRAASGPDGSTRGTRSSGAAPRCGPSRAARSSRSSCRSTSRPRPRGTPRSSSSASSRRRSAPTFWRAGAASRRPRRSSPRRCTSCPACSWRRS